MNDDPFSCVVRNISTMNTTVAKIVRKYTQDNVSDMSLLTENVRRASLSSDTSRCNVYMDINPTMKVHDVYKVRHAINDLHRVSFTRFRVSGHSLAIETGRWNRRGRGRLPVEERVCVCGVVQTERHVVENCPTTQHVRDYYAFNSLDDLFSNFSNDDVCKIVHDLLRLYD